MIRKWADKLLLMWVICLALAIVAWSQQQQTNPQQDIPDAPSTVQPPPPAPEPQKPPAEEEPAKQPKLPESQLPPSSSSPQPTGEQPPGPPPPMKITTVPEGSVPKEPPETEDQLFKLRVNVNQVVVPVRVTDDSGQLVSGLLPADFSVYEDGKKQKLNFFTSDPFALSAAIVVDLGMSDISVQKVDQTFAALEGAFAPFDEVSVYAYSDAVSQLTGFQGVGRQLDAALNRLKGATGEVPGVPVTGGPMGPQGPTINGVPMGDPTTPVITPAKHARVLNDAILRAALDLGKREKKRRKVIFVISDGREYRSDASYKAVMQVLLSNEIMVYGVAVGSSAIPIYRSLEKLRIPGQGYSDILPKYASATGGEIMSEYSARAMEDVYQRLIGDARNQYTLGYVTRATPSDTQREIEVRVARPGCKSSDTRPCVNVYAKQGYYPLPARP
jgi:VWFA-related protein